MKKQIKRPVYYYLNPLAISVMFILSPWAFGDDYFDPSFLGLSGETNPIDLSAFSQEGGVAEGKYTLAVFLNQQDVGQLTLMFKKNSRNIVAPQITPKQLALWGVNVTNIPDLKSLPLDQPIDDLSEYIPQAVTKFDLARLRLDISIPQVAMDPQYVRYADPAQWQDGIPALIFNYNLSAGQTRNKNQGGETSQTNNVFASVRAGANMGPWRLRSNITHTSVEYSGRENQSSNTQQQTRFSNTYLSRDIKGLRSSLLVGEANTSGDIFDSVSFRGIKLNSNEQMLPSQLRGYAPSIRGISNSNARITVRQNGNIVYESRSWAI